MEKQEFLLLIPAIIYGVAIVDLLKIFNHKKNYIEMLGWGFYVMIGLIFTWIELFNKLETVTGDNISFFLIIFQAVLFARAAALITPEANHSDTKEYFMEIRKRFFWLLSVIALYGIMMRYFAYEEEAVHWLRPLIIIIYMVVGYSNNYWVRLSGLVIILVLALARVFTGALV